MSNTMKTRTWSLNNQKKVELKKREEENAKRKRNKNLQNHGRSYEL